MLKYVKKLLTFGESFVVLLPDANEHRLRFTTRRRAIANETRGHGASAHATKEIT